jgi:glutathione S-transferase
MTTQALTIARTFDAPRTRVFDAFTKKEAIEAWFGPEGFTVPSVTIDPRPGGSYRIEMHSPEGSVHVVTGEFREVRPPEKLVYSWAWLEGDQHGIETTVTLTFAEKSGQTEVTLVHSGFSNAEAQTAHQGGWTSSFACLDGALAGTVKQATARPTLLGDPRSSYVRSVRMVFIEKGIAYALEPHAPHSPPVGAIHPFGKVPAFRCGALTLFETSAIVRYVDEAFPGPKLMPDTPADRARAEQWISAVLCYFYPAMIQRFVLQYIFPKGADGKPDRAVIDKAIEEMTMQFAILDAAYGIRNYLVGDRVTLADLMLAPIVFYVQAMPEGKDVLAPFAGVRRAYAAIAARPSFASTMPPMG